ncbi:MAG: ribosomal L7Ae/L30e/S12e/Gadd45 family protein [Negativicutes bacterium]|nr:ribosomal L7Ae/L30e/S12e/Gadd45 family protein [Negativicutes bacterium]
MSLEHLKNAKKSIGAKQTAKTIEKGKAAMVFIAKDADERVIHPIRTQCAQKGVLLIEVATMAELGKACGIEVGAATAAVLK